MRNILETIAGKYKTYCQSKSDFCPQTSIPFRVSPVPFQLSTEQRDELYCIGVEVVDYLSACNELYQTDDVVRGILNTGKPEIFLVDRFPQYLFVRPDLILTPAGFTLCEIETSPFGLALAEILNRAYRQKGFETLVGDNDLLNYIRQSTPTDGTIIYTDKTISFKGQMMFLADEVFSAESRNWQAKHIGEVEGQAGNIYRGFYLAEYLSDPSVKLLLDSYSKKNEVILPSLTAYMEEKALLALLWDKRWQGFFQKQLGTVTFNHLRAVIPPTWIVGQEKYFALGFSTSLETAIDLASLSRSKRTFVLKSSGFSQVSSWSKGVTFLHKKPREYTKEVLSHVSTDETSLYIIQEFRKGLTMPLRYEDDNGNQQVMMARIRLTPYFSAVSSYRGKLLAIKATACEKTDYIHATSTSINVAVC